MTVHHRVDGRPDAPALVLSGALGTTLAMWEPQLPALAGRFTVVRYDHPGHGGSAVPDRRLSIGELGHAVLGLIDELGLERVSFCGLSLGALVGMWLGSRAPERLVRLVLCCTAARFPPPERWDERAATVRREGMEAIADAQLARWFTARFRAASPGVVAQYRRMLASIPAEGYALGCETVRDADLRDALGAIAVPTLVVAGSDDPTVAPAAVEELLEGIPGARLVELPGAGHLANAEQPDAFTDALLSQLGAAAVT